MAKDRFKARNARWSPSSKPSIGSRYDQPPTPRYSDVRGYLPTRADDAVRNARYARAVRHPRVSRDGRFLMGAQLYQEIAEAQAAAPVELCDLDLEFLEDIADRIRANEEVGQRWQSSTKQDQWLSDIHVRVGAGP